jgi:hypothetical protein
VGQRSVEKVGEHCLDDRVAAVDDAGLRGRQIGVGKERVIATPGTAPRGGERL